MFIFSATKSNQSKIKLVRLTFVITVLQFSSSVSNVFVFFTKEIFQKNISQPDLKSYPVYSWKNTLFNWRPNQYYAYVPVGTDTKRGHCSHKQATAPNSQFINCGTCAVIYLNSSKETVRANFRQSRWCTYYSLLLHRKEASRRTNAQVMQHGINQCDDKERTLALSRLVRTEISVGVNHG